MQILNRRSFVSGATVSCATALFGLPARASPRRYALLPGQSGITFAFTLNNALQTGTVPIAQAEISVDPDNLAASSADVAADLRGAKTGFFFATEALKSPKVLDTAHHRLVRYVTKRINLSPSGRIDDGATVDGVLTLRGVSRPLRLAAKLTRPSGSDANDLSRLFIRLQGNLNRSDFGATGYSEIVADRVNLDIRAAITAA